MQNSYQYNTNKPEVKGVRWLGAARQLACLAKAVSLGPPSWLFAGCVPAVVKIVFLAKTQLL